MGIWLILFNPNQFENDHSNCSAKTIDQWNALGTPNLSLGILYALMGLVCEVSTRYFLTF